MVQSDEPEVPSQATAPVDSQVVKPFSVWSSLPLYVASFVCLALMPAGFFCLHSRTACRETLAYWNLSVPLLGFVTLALYRHRAAREAAERLRHQEALRQSEERYRTLFENATVGIYRTTGDGRVLAANPALVRMLGYEAFEELSTRNLEEDGFEPRYSRRAFRQQMEWDGVIKGLESAWLKRDGSTVFIRESAQAVRNGAGPVMYYDGVVEDISECKRAEQALRESEELFRTTFENAGIGMALVDLGGYPIKCNPALQKMLGYTEKELGRIAFAEFTHSEDRESHGKSNGEHVEANRDKFEIEKRYPKKGGQLVWGHLTGSLVRDVDGAPKYGVALLEDISQRKQGEMNLRESQAELAAAQRLAHVGSWRWNVRTDEAYWTDETFRIFGRPPGRLEKHGTRFVEMLHPDDQARVSQALSAAVEGTAEYDLEYRLVRPDGVERIVHTQAEVLRDDSDRPTMLRGMVHDITERHRAEEAMREGEARLRTIFDSVQTGIFIIDPESHRIVDANPAALETIDVARNQALGAECHQFICPAERGKCPVTDLAQTVDNSERILLAADGKNRTVIKNVVTVVISGRRHLLESVVDITERKRTEEALHLTQFSVDHASDAVFWMDPQSRIVYVNHAACRALGYSREELLSLCIPDIDPLFSRERWTRFWEEIKLRGSRTFETQHRTKQNKVFPVEIIATYLQFGGKDYSLAFVRDITERKRAAAELADQLRFETLLADLSARFVNVPADQLDSEIGDAQRRVCECLELDVSTLWEASSENPNVLTLTHLYRPLGGPPLPEQMDVYEYFPWSYGQLLARKEMSVAISSLEDLPAEAARDLESWRRYDMHSALVVGLSVGGGPPVGALSFNTVRAERVWPEKIVNRLQVVAQMLANALARQHSDRALRESEEKYRVTFQNIPAGVLVIEKDGSISMMNAEASRLSGCSLERLAGTDLVDWQSATVREDGSACSVEDLPVNRCFRTGEPQGDTVLGVRRLDGSIFYSVHSATPVMDPASGKVVRVVLAYRDITEQKQAERRQRLTVEVLDILNRDSGKSETIGEILHVVKAYGGYDAVGIRLREGGEFPYFVQEGLSPEFVQSENSLCSRLPDGTPCRDESGQPILECACGLVLRGRTDLTNPLFTPGGSFWTNRAGQVLDWAPCEDPRQGRRNRCLQEAYESVALIPIRIRQEVIGLLQLNDHRPDRFRLDTIRFLEGISTSIGLGLARWREADALCQSEQFNREVISNAHEGVIVYDHEFRYVVWNQFMEDLTGVPAAQALGRSGFELFPHLLIPNAESLLRQALDGETAQSPDTFFEVPATGKSAWVSATYSPHVDVAGKIVGVVGMIREVTKRKQAEEALRERELQLSLFVRHSPAAIAMLDREMRYLVVSRRWTTDYRLGKRDIHGLSHYDLVPETPERWKEIHRRCLAGAVESCEEDSFPRQDGTLDWVRWEIRPWRRIDGSIGGIIIFSENITERKQTREALQHSLDQVRALAGRLQSVREEESKRLAREIHDQLGQALTALRLDFNSLISELPGGPHPPPKRASSILRLVDDTIQSVRRISSELRPGMLDDLGLVATVEWAGEDFEARTGIKCRLALPQKDFVIDSGLATAVFRILQEALTNVARHADASAVDVRLSEEERALVLIVHDNGKGMAADKLANTQSLGILGMQERALIFGGGVIVCSAPGMGTTVRVKIPENRA